MNATEAQDHLRMVDGIVRATDRRLHLPPAFLLVIGVPSTTFTAVEQARQMGRAGEWADVAQALVFLAMLCMLGIFLWRGRRAAARETLIDGYAGAAFLAALAVGATLNITAQHRVVPAAGIGLFWAASFCMALLVAGAMGSRILLAGGVAMLLATGAASLVPGWLPGILAVGWCLGFVVTGLALALGARRGRTAAV